MEPTRATASPQSRRRKPSTATRALAITFGPSGALPTEFRLFVEGWNDTENGRFLFDQEAAKSVMAAHEKWGVDLAIDLEHQMLISDVPPEPNARDARGWCRLELRPDGSLWATAVTWTPDGAQRLAEKRQRYVSPAFNVDPETSRVTAIVNIALVAIPATHDTPALVAASARGDKMDSALVTKALDALIEGNAESCMEILKGMVASAAGGDADAATEDAPPPVGDGGADETTEMAAADPAPPAPPEKKEEVVAASARLMRLTGAASFVDAIDVVESYRKSHIALEAETQKLAAERALLESAERRKGCIELVTLAGRAPATVWADDKAKKPKKYLSAMPMEDFREYVKDAIKAGGGRRSGAAVEPPSETVDAVHNLTASQQAACKEYGCDPAVFAQLKARIAPTS